MERLPAELAELLAPRVARLGYLGEFFQCCAHQPDALAHLIRFTETLKHSVPAEIVEVIALTVGVTLGNDYERNQHERLCMALGFGADWDRQVEASAATGTCQLDEPLAACQRFTLRACRPSDRSTPEAFFAVAEALGPEAAIGVVLTVARYVAHALVVRSLNLAPPVPPIGEEES
jgi:hypothetical protein